MQSPRSVQKFFLILLKQALQRNSNSKKERAQQALAKATNQRATSARLPPVPFSPAGAAATTRMLPQG